MGGIIVPPIIIAGAAELDESYERYLVSAALISSGLLSTVQITRIRIPKTRYALGTGLVSIVGISFATVSLAPKAISQMRSNGRCPASGPCVEGYGAVLGTAAVCSLFEMLMSFIPPRYMRKIFPPLVTGPVIVLIGVELIQTGLRDWAGGSGSCYGRPSAADAPGYQLCPSNDGKHALPWGSPQFLGLGFSVFAAIVIIERFGSPIMRTSAVALGLVVGIIISVGAGYFDNTSIRESPGITFLWVKTFPLTVYGPLVLPFIAIYAICMMEAIGDVTNTCELSRIPEEEFGSRIQGGVLADGFNGLLAALFTISPMATFAQNNGILSLTRVVSRSVGYSCCFWLVFSGVIAKFAAIFTSIPKPVLGGLECWLFSSVVASGVRIIAYCKFTRRDRFVLAAQFTLGFGSIVVPDYFTYFFTYSGNNTSLIGFLDAITLVMETPYAVSAFIGVIINAIVPAEHEDPDQSPLPGADGDFVEVAHMPAIHGRQEEEEMERAIRLEHMDKAHKV